ncbi:MAG: tetratricopeptide repeat protein [Paludibacteraceae bacterium]|nr:tetratricopeptide repeat protein [Paludibacteraceae bacterium]MBR4705971.1 tetratricopeptide repeat protein [Paludibacteraceae bacterium]
MKKSLILAALVLISAGCMAQKNPLVKKAKSLINSETPDFGAARAAIAEALEQEPTAETYYWAGMIGYQEVTRQNYNQLMGQAADVAVTGAAASESYEYWLKADELAQVPVLNKKGEEVPTDPKMRAKLAKMMLEYYKNQELVKYGVHLNESRDFLGAFKAFKMHIDIPELPMMQNEKLQKEMPRDTIYIQYKYYAGIFAIQAEMHDDAIAILEQLKDGDYEAVSTNQFLYQEYVTKKDTAKFVETLQNAIVRFPSEPWFLQNLINYYIYSGQEKTAIDYLAQAIEREPNVAQYHLIKGNLDENQGNYDAALTDFDNALRLDPTMADAMAGKGRVYYNQAVKLNEAAASIQDNKEYKQALDEMNEVFRKSLPFFEKAHEMAPEERNYIQTLKGLYYRFGMEDKENEMKELLEKL